jgi:predicted metal-dependent phosphoesterase TrpH
MVRARADLHVHSTYSDGVYTPTQLVEMAAELDLGGLALTDHDTLGGNEEFLDRGKKSGLDCIPGVEISTDYQGYELHLLGYFVPDDSRSLEEQLMTFKDERHTRFPKMVKRLREMGIDIPEADVEEVLKNAASPGRPHLARILIKMGVVKTIDEAFERYLAEGRPAYVRRERPDISKGIAMLRTVGAVPVLAHPLYYSGEHLAGLLRNLKALGLMGVEVVYNYNRETTLEEDTKEVQRSARGLNLIETGGTDFHGDDTHNTLGSMTVPKTVINQLRMAAEEIRGLKSEQ